MRTREAGSELGCKHWRTRQQTHACPIYQIDLFTHPSIAERQHTEGYLEGISAQQHRRESNAPKSTSTSTCVVRRCSGGKGFALHVDRRCYNILHKTYLAASSSSFHCVSGRPALEECSERKNPSYRAERCQSEREESICNRGKKR